MKGRIPVHCKDRRGGDASLFGLSFFFKKMNEIMCFIILLAKGVGGYTISLLTSNCDWCVTLFSHRQTKIKDAL